MKALRRVVVAVVAVAVVLVGADRLVAHEVASGIASGIAGPNVVRAEATGLCEAAADCEPRVQVGGFPVLTQLASGRLTHLSVDVPGYRVAVGDSSATIEDIHADFRGVTTTRPHVARSLSASGALTADSLTRVVNASGVPGTVGIGPQGISFEGTVLGVSASAQLSVSIDEGGRGLLLAPESLTVGGQQVSLSSHGAGSLLMVPVSLDALPAGLVVTDLSPADGRLSATFSGTDVNLSALAPGTN